MTARIDPKKEDIPHVGKRIREKSLHYSVLDGTFYSLMVGFGDSFFAAFAVLLRATNVQLGILGSLPMFLGSVLQVFTTRMLLLFRTRKRLVTTFVLLQALMYIPIALVFLFGKNDVWLLILFVSLYFIFGMIQSPAWNSWMGDLIREQERGAYFGKRSKINGFANFVAFIAAGYFLQRFGDGSWHQYLAFAVIFSLALVARFVSLFYLTRQYEPPRTPERPSKKGLLWFARKGIERNYGSFTLFASFMNFSVYLSAPFFTVYMLSDLHMGYLLFTVVTGMMIASKLFFMPVWGHACDTFGPRRVLALTGFLIPFVPILWMFSTDIEYLLAVQVYSGFVWAGFEIAAVSFIYDSTEPKERASSIAYYNIFNGVMILAGGLVGGLLAKHNHVFWSAYLFLFLLSGILRFVVACVFVPRIREVRPRKHIEYTQLLTSVMRSAPLINLLAVIVAWRSRGDGAKDGGRMPAKRKA